MSVAAFLAELRSRDMEVWADGDQLRCSAPVGALTPEMREGLRRRKHDILEFLRSADALARQQRAIVPLQPSGTRPPVFGIGGHNGDVFCYRVLAQRLGREQPFFGLQPPGLDGQSAPLTRVEDLAAYFAEQIREFQRTGPFVLAGFCAGATIAFEVARQLVQGAGPRPSVVALFAGPYPPWYRALPQLRERAGYVIGRLRHHARALASLSIAEARRYITEHVRHRATQREASRQAASDPVLAPRRKVEEVTLSAVKGYLPAYFDGRLSLFVPNRRWLRSRNLSRRWGRVAREIDEYVGPDDCEGDVMLREPFVDVTAALFQRMLR